MNLLQRIEDDDYHKEILYELNKKWGKDIFVKSDIMYDGEKCYTIKRENVKTEEDRKAYLEDMQRWMRYETWSKEYDKKYLFKMITKYIENWWD